MPADSRQLRRPVRPAAPGSDGGGRPGPCRGFAACWAAVRGPFCFCRFRQACASWRRPFSSFPAASPFMIPGCLPAGLPARSGGGAAAAGAVGVSHRPVGPAVGPGADSAWLRPPPERICCCAAGTVCPCCWRWACVWAAGRVSLSGVSPGMCLAAALLIRQRPGAGAGPGSRLGCGSGAVYGPSGGCAGTLRLWRCCPCPAPPCPGSVPPLSRCASGPFCAVGAGCVLLLGMEEPLYRVIELASGGILSLLPLPRLTPAAGKKGAPAGKAAPAGPLRQACRRPAGPVRQLFPGHRPGKAGKSLCVV